MEEAEKRCLLHIMNCIDHATTSLKGPFGNTELWIAPFSERDILIKHFNSFMKYYNLDDWDHYLYFNEYKLSQILEDKCVGHTKDELNAECKAYLLQGTLDVIKTNSSFFDILCYIRSVYDTQLNKLCCYGHRGHTDITRDFYKYLSDILKNGDFEQTVCGYFN